MVLTVRTVRPEERRPKTGNSRASATRKSCHLKEQPMVTCRLVTPIIYTYALRKHSGCIQGAFREY
jgi:hypothetical protein